MSIRISLPLLIFSAIMITSEFHAQHVPALDKKKPGEDWDNIFIEKIADDSSCTSFHIWIKGGVKHHFHASHTECIYIIEGEGTMELGEAIFPVKPGDFIQVPKGQVHAVTASKPLHVISIQTPQWTTDDRKFVQPIRRPHNE